MQVRGVRPIPLTEMADLFISLHIGVAPGLVSLIVLSFSIFMAMCARVCVKGGDIVSRLKFSYNVLKVCSPGPLCSELT